MTDEVRIKISIAAKLREEKKWKIAD
jgi:hypothetical protein